MSPVMTDLTVAFRSDFKPLHAALTELRALTGLRVALTEFGAAALRAHATLSRSGVALVPNPRDVRLARRARRRELRARYNIPGATR